MSLLNLAAGLLILTASMVAGAAVASHLYLSGALTGLLIVFFALVLLRKIPDFLADTSQLLLKHMSLFFVPATLSVFLLNDLLAEVWWMVLTALLLSTLAGMAVTIGICKLTKLAQRSRHE